MNQKLRTFEITFKTLSPVSLSPRESYCFYKYIDFESEQLKNFYKEADICQRKKEKTEESKEDDDRYIVESVNILYPFYQYGEYEIFDPEKAEYYTPGSSIKGALGWQNKQDEEKLYVDDYVVNQTDLTIKIPEKLQQANSNSKMPKFKEFFNNVAVEMLKQGVEFTLTVRSTEDIVEYLSDVYDKNREKFKNAVAIVGTLISEMEKNKDEIHENNTNQSDDWDKKIEEIEDFKKTLESLQKQDIILLGGYKGEALSKSDMGENGINNYQGTFYRDVESEFPFGVVKILSIEDVGQQKSTQKDVQS